MKRKKDLLQKFKVFAPKAILSFLLLTIGTGMTMGDTAYMDTQNQLSEEIVTLQASQEELLSEKGFKEFLALGDIDKEIEKLNELNQSYIDEKIEVERLIKEEEDKRIAEEKAEEERKAAAEKAEAERKAAEEAEAARKAAADKAEAERKANAAKQEPPKQQPVPKQPQAENFKNCTELRKVYPEGVPQGHPAYTGRMDRDKDGWACEITGKHN